MTDTMDRVHFPNENARDTPIFQGTKCNIAAKLHSIPSVNYIFVTVFYHQAFIIIRYFVNCEKIKL